MSKYSILILLLFSYFLGVKLYSFPRQFLDLFALFVSLFFLNKNSVWVFTILVISSFIAFFHNNSVYGFINLSLVPIILLSYKPTKRIFSDNLVYGLILYSCILSLGDFVNGNFVEGGDRISGPFTSSLHLSYYCVWMAVYVCIKRPKYYYFVFLLILIPAMVSGSRVAAISVIGIFFLTLPSVGRLYSVLILLPLIVYSVNLLELRSFSYIPEAESIRFGGFERYLDELDLTKFLIGEGRMNYGATGYRFVGENAFITESSMIMIIYSYGIVLGIMILFYIIKGFREVTKSNIILFLGLILLVIFSPFMDSTALLLINLLIISNLNLKNG